MTPVAAEHGGTVLLHVGGITIRFTADEAHQIGTMLRRMARKAGRTSPPAH